MSSIFQRPELAESMANQLSIQAYSTKVYAQVYFYRGCAAQVKQRF